MMKKVKKIQPKKAPNRKRNQSLSLRFTEDELNLIREKFNSTNEKSITDFILKCVKNEKIIVVQELFGAMREIRKQGVNVNQMARAVNQIALKVESENHFKISNHATIERFAIKLDMVQQQNKDMLCLLDNVLKEVKK